MRAIQKFLNAMYDFCPITYNINDNKILTPTKIYKCSHKVLVTDSDDLNFSFPIRQTRLKHLFKNCS